MEGLVRGILERHAHPGASQATLGAPQAPPGPHPPPDPNALLPAAPLAARLASLPPQEQRRLGADYAALWGRTFRTLVSHLRGRPERALALFVEEVYPFLRGDRRAARVERTGPGSARLSLAPDLPAPYLCGLVEGFVALSGARVEATPAAGGLLDVQYRIGPGQGLARATERLATLRLGLVLAIVLSAALGLAVASRQVEVSPVRALAVLAGAAAAQLGANALHDLRNAHPAGPLAPIVVRREVLLAQAAAGIGAAAAVGLWLALTGTPIVLLFGAVGLGVAFLYAPLRDRGLGPIVLAVLYGPLVAVGALSAFGPEGLAIHVLAVSAGLVPGALAAATLYLDDLADAPLDEAGGKRTLAVRLPRRQQATVYGVLLAVGLAPLAAFDVLDPTFPPLALFLPLAIAAAVLVARVSRRIGDPQALAPARLGTQLLQLCATALAIVLGMVLP